MRTFLCSLILLFGCSSNDEPDGGASNQDAIVFDSGMNDSGVVDTGPAVDAGPDLVSPIVQFRSPDANATVSGTVQVQIAAVDNVAVATVELQVDHIEVWTSSAAPYAYLWDTTQIADGPHTLTALASDTSQNVGSFSIDLEVDNH